MTCQWIVVHRLLNPKPKQRREPCGRKAGMRRVDTHAGPQKVWLCSRHSPCIARKVSTEIPLFSAGRGLPFSEV